MADKHDAIRDILESHVMFATLSAKDKAELARMFVLKEYMPGERLVRQNEYTAGVLHIYSGQVRLKQTVEGRRTALGDFGPGSTFGETCLLHETVWEYELVAGQDQVKAIVLPAESAKKFAAEHAEAAALFRKNIGQIELSHRLKSLIGSSTCPPARFALILNNLGVKKIPKGSAVFSQNDNDPRLYSIEQGTVDIIRQEDGEEITLDRCARFELLGETAALSEAGNNDCHFYTARAVTDVTVIVIRQPEVLKLMALNPSLHEQLITRARDLRQIAESELDARSRAVNTDMRIRLARGITEDEYKQLEEQDRENDEEFPLMRQGDQSECGAACLTMITRYYGKNFKLGQIKELANVSTADTSPLPIITGAENLGYSAKAYALNRRELERVRLPGIIGWEGGHYAVVHKVTSGRLNLADSVAAIKSALLSPLTSIKVSPEDRPNVPLKASGLTSAKVHLADPLEGRKILPMDEFITGWTSASVPGTQTDEDRGLFIALTPTEKFTHMEPPKLPVLHFVRYLLPYKKFFFEAFLAALTINLLGLASPLFVQTIVDTVVVHKDVSLLNMMLGGMALVTVFTTLTTVVQRLLLAHTTARIDMRLMSEFYRHILSLPMSFFLTRNKGEIMARFGENAKIRAILTGSTITVILNTLMLGIYFLMMFAYSLPLTMIVLAFIPGYVLLILYFTPRIKALAQKIFHTNAQSQAYLIEALNGIETIKATANEYMARVRWENSFVENVNNTFKQANLVLTSSSLHSLLRLASSITILWYGANQVIAGQLSIGELMGFNMLVGLVMGPVQQMVQLWNQMQDVRISVERVSEILDIEPERPTITSPDAMPAVLTQCSGKIEFRDVDFSYMAGDKENLVMRKFSLEIDPGEHIALVGPSGCGKSTIAKMILGFNLPKNGQCLIDGKDLANLDFSSLRNHIGVVLQDSFLIAGTVAENIALGDPEPDLAAVKRAARQAGIEAEILRWPQGYQTAIGEKGMGISGGQRQRVCIARALYRQPKILIFDEATSALDNDSEKIIQSNMREILKGRTSITIAHRLSTIVDADRICYIIDGMVAEQGKHQQLIDPEYIRENGLEGKYYALARKQFNLPPLDEAAGENEEGAA
ncbi:peptidase domain-containing ABC transporter [Maridesulfovibrio sp.]|uniref:peptidase domain-containing ABC transporter n=1 Tax=Maridesulfovibrio sp. TaxID=2795000 RepID=UPI002A1899EA|nr:peptidase domain-containing ABC transporter [Maridesulfovibrio sp.]